MKSIIFAIGCSLATLTSFTQNLHFRDSLFYKTILDYSPSIDLNGDGFIQLDEAKKVLELNLSEKKLMNVEDIRHFVNLKSLNLSDNKITKLELHDLDYLEKLYCAKNNLTVLNISNMPSLEAIYCGRNNLESVSLVNLKKIKSINLMDNKLQNFEVRSFEQLQYLVIDNNQLTKIDISNNLKLEQLVINGNNILHLNLKKNKLLKIENLYIDDKTELIGTSNQLNRYKKAPVIISN